MKRKELALEEDQEKMRKEFDEEQEKKRKERQQKQKNVDEAAKKKDKDKEKPQIIIQQLANEWNFVDPEFILTKQDHHLLKKVFIALAKEWNLAMSLVPSNPNGKLRDWIPDDRFPKCSLCQVKYSFFKRRHHCRICGEVYCNACSDHKKTLTRFKLYDVRVCDFCHIIIQAMEDPSESKDKKSDKLSSKDEETSTPPVTTHRRLDSAPSAVVSTSAPATPAGGTPAGGTPNGGTPTVGSPLQTTTSNTNVQSTPNTNQSS